MDRGSAGGDDPQSFRRPLQAERSPKLRGGVAETPAARPRRHAAGRHPALRRPRPRGPTAGRGTRPEQHPELPHAASRHLPAGASTAARSQSILAIGSSYPPCEGGRDRTASPEEAAHLVAAVPDRDRAMWATALYGGLRRGELMALLWEDVDLTAGVIRVERSWDRRSESPWTPSHGAVGVACRWRDRFGVISSEQRLLTGSGEGLVFGRTSAAVRLLLDARSGHQGSGASPDSSRSGCTSAATRSRA